jgi:type IV pilus assembly protein PilM
MFSLFKKNDLVGLDIGTSSVKATQLKRVGKGFELMCLGIAPIPPETIVDGVIMDANAVVSAINQIFTENAIKTKEVAVAVSGHSVIVKKIRMTQMKEEELRESIQWEAEQYIPFAIEDVNIDFQIIGASTSQSQEMEVLLVAVKKDIVNDYQTIISSAGLSTAVVDVDAFALENAYAISYEIKPDELVALVNLGAAVMTINILKNGISTFTRDSVFGGNRFTEAIQKGLSLSYDQAEKLKMGQEVEGHTLEKAKPIIDEVNNELAGEIRRSFDFFRSSSQDDRIHKLILSGGSARLPGILDFLSQSLEIPGEIANPLRNIKSDPKRFDPEYLDYISPQAAISVGLALRQVGDK